MKIEKVTNDCDKSNANGQRTYGLNMATAGVLVTLIMTFKQHDAVARGK